MLFSERNPSENLWQNKLIMQFFARISEPKNKNPAPESTEAGLVGTLVTSSFINVWCVYKVLILIYLYKSINLLPKFLNERRVIFVKRAAIHIAAHTLSFTIYPNGVDCKGSHLFRFRKGYELFYDYSYRSALLLGSCVQPFLGSWRYAPSDYYRSSFDGCFSS